MQPDCRSARLRAVSALGSKNSAPGCGRLRSQTLPVSFTVELAHKQLDIGGSLELFRRSGDDLIDRWDGTNLIRVAFVPEHGWAPFVARANGNLRSPAFEVSVMDCSHVAHISKVVANTFMPAPPDWQRLRAEDPLLARLDQLFPGIRQ